METYQRTIEIKYSDLCTEILNGLPDYARTYVRSIHNNTAPRTRYEYLKDIKMFLSYMQERHSWSKVTLQDLSSLTKNDFEEYFEYLEHYEKDGVEYSNTRVSIKRKMSALRKFFAYLFKSGFIQSDEIRKVELPKLHKKAIIRLENDEASTLLNAIENGTGLTEKELQYHKRDRVRDLAIFVLFMTTGLRVSELCGLDLDDLNMLGCSLRVVRKGGDQTTVFFPDLTRPYLADYLRIRMDLKDKLPNEKALFLSSRQQRMAVRTIEVMIKKYARIISGKNITPHKLRATYATRLYELTSDIYLVAENLGHKDVATTKDHYADLSDRKKQESRNLVTI